jgi:hypothetical protein
LGSVPFFTIDNSKIVRRRKKELLLFTGFRFESCGSPLHLMNKLRITYKDGYELPVSEEKASCGLLGGFSGEIKERTN